MRAGVVVVAAVLAAACVRHELELPPHQLFDDPRAAIRAILAAEPTPRVYAVGEYHPTRAAVARHAPLARFTSEIVGLLEPRAQHLVVEAWLEEGCYYGGHEPLGVQVARATGRPASTARELAELTDAGQLGLLGLEVHGIPMTCIEQGALLDPRGRVDFLRLLQAVTVKLHEAARALALERRAVIVYGGALHNDLFPRWPLESLSYARGLADELGGGVLELDLVVPEIVAGMRLREPWVPLLALAAPARVIVWARGPGSYVVILPRA